MLPDMTDVRSLLYQSSPLLSHDSLRPGHPVLMFFRYCQAWVLIPNPSLRSLRILPAHYLSFYPVFRHGMSRARDAEQRTTKNGQQGSVLAKEAKAGGKGILPPNRRSVALSLLFL